MTRCILAVSYEFGISYLFAPEDLASRWVHDQESF